jgi:hypothetical protein
MCTGGRSGSLAGDDAARHPTRRCGSSGGCICVGRLTSPAGRRNARVPTAGSGSHPPDLHPRAQARAPTAHLHTTGGRSYCPAPATSSSSTAGLRPRRGLKRLPSAQVISAGQAFVGVSAEATTNSGLHADRGIGSRRSSPNSLWPLIRHLRRRRLLSANATDPVGDRGLVALRLASWPRSYLGGGACEIWPVANATLSLRLIASCRISATARPFRGGQPLRAESRTFELDAARLAGPARLGVLTGEVETVVGGGA